MILLLIPSLPHLQSLMRFRWWTCQVRTCLGLSLLVLLGYLSPQTDCISTARGTCPCSACTPPSAAAAHNLLLIKQYGSNSLFLKSKLKIEGARDMVSESHAGKADMGEDEGLSWAKYPAFSGGYLRLHSLSRVRSCAHRAGGGESFLTTALISWCPEEWRLITFIFGCRTANVTNGHKITQSFSKYNRSKLIYWAQFIQYFLLWQNSQKIICLLHVSTIWCHSMQTFFPALKSKI